MFFVKKDIKNLNPDFEYQGFFPAPPVPVSGKSVVESKFSFQILPGVRNG